jgi:DNA (cytosine-5)-methyltransferase 1
VTFGSLFAGIGGMDLGLERAGLECRWQVEISDYCRQVLARHWPLVRRYADVKECGAQNLERVDCIAGGFPCQDISSAGSGAGLDGERSGLWEQFRRIVGELGPDIVLVENVAALTARGLGQVLSDLAELRFDAEWSDLFACEMGQTHARRRLFVVAYSNREHGRPRLRDSIAQGFRPLQSIDGFEGARAGHVARLANPSALYGGADGVPYRMERNRGIGNAVSPDVAEWIGRRLMATCDRDVLVGDAEGVTTDLDAPSVSERS